MGGSAGAPPRTPRTLAQKIVDAPPTVPEPLGLSDEDEEGGVDASSEHYVSEPVRDTMSGGEDAGGIVFTDNGRVASADEGKGVSGGAATSSRPVSARRGPPGTSERAGYSAFRLPVGAAAPAAAPAAGASVHASSRPSSARPNSALRVMTPRSGALPPSRGLYSARNARPASRGGAMAPSARSGTDENNLAVNLLGLAPSVNSASSSVCSESGSGQ